MAQPDVVVAPVVTKEALARDLYLPTGRWVARVQRWTAPSHLGIALGGT